MNTPPIQINSNMTAEAVTFDDEDSSDLIISELPGKTFQPTFHNSKFNKKIYPSGFNVSLARSANFSHGRDHARTSTNSPGPISCAAIDNHHEMQPKASFMFWAKGLPTSSSSERRQLPDSRNAPSAPGTGGSWRSIPSSSMRQGTPSIRECLTEDADEWLMVQITNAKDDIDSDILISSPHFEPQDLKKSRQKLFLRNNFDATSSHQLSPFDLDLANTRLVSRKVSLNTSYVGFRPQNVKGVELKEFISYDDWSMKSRQKSVSDEMNRSRTYPAHTVDTISAESFVDSSSMESIAMNTLDTDSCKEDERQQQHQLISRDNAILPNLNKRRTQTGQINMNPLAGRMILMVYRYKTMMESSSCTAFEKPALMLDIRSSVKYSVIFKIIADFSASKEFDLSKSALVTTSPPHSAAGNVGDHTRNRSNVELFYFHINSKAWRAIKDEGTWSSAIMLCLEKNQPLKVMVSRGKEVESKDIYEEYAPKGMPHARMDNLKDSIGDSKKLLAIMSCMNNLNGDVGGYLSAGRRNSDVSQVQSYSSPIPSDNISPLIITEKLRYDQIEEISIKQKKIKEMIAALHHADRVHVSRTRLEGQNLGGKAISGTLQVMAKAYPQPLTTVSGEIITFSNTAAQLTNMKKNVLINVKPSSLLGGKVTIKKSTALLEKRTLLAETLGDKLTLSRW